MEKIDIINKALTLLGANSIVTEDDKTIEAETSKQLYDSSLCSILSEANWNFATKRILLSPADKKPAWGQGVYFELPADFIILCEKSEDCGVEGNYLLANTNSLGIKYISKCTNESLYPIYFIDAFVYKLASDMCYKITNSSEKAQNLLQIYKSELLPMAKNKNAREQSQKRLISDAWVIGAEKGRWG